MKFNPTTINNYMALFANKGGISLTENSIAKTNACWTAKHSSIKTMALIIVAATTHFYVVANEDTEWRQFLKTLPDESKQLYKMVSKFHGEKPVCVRSPHLITNQDNETEFICKGKQVDKSSRVGLVATTALKTQSTLSMYHQDDSNYMTGLRVKRHLLGNNFLVCSNKELNQLGCYLHYNCNEGVWIRSGSATGECGFSKRLKTHLERALSDRKDDDSRFYHSFPSKTNAHANSCSKEGYFEYLTAYVGVGFLVEHPPGCFLKSGRLLIYTKEEEKWISGLNF
jgi:hypothetical protein